MEVAMVEYVGVAGGVVGGQDGPGTFDPGGWLPWIGGGAVVLGVVWFLFFRR